VSERPADPTTTSAPTAAPSLRAIATVAAIGAVAVVILGPVGTRIGLWGSGIGLGLFRGAMPLAMVAIAIAIPEMRRSAWGRRGLAVIVVALLAAAPPIWIWWTARGAPSIADITTDLDNPPRYVAVTKLRVPPANAAAYAGDAVAVQQRAAYADLRPLIVTAPPARVLAMAADTARAEGWTVLAQDIGFADLGRLEATDATFLFGRLDDIVVRVVPHAAGSRVDVRSSARNDVADEGRNARRIRHFLAYLAERARAEPPAATAR
jgi:hypothetical protein